MWSVVWFAERSVFISQTGEVLVRGMLIARALIVARLSTLPNDTTQSHIRHSRWKVTATGPYGKGHFVGSATCDTCRISAGHSTPRYNTVECTALEQCTDRQWQWCGDVQ